MIIIRGSRLEAVVTLGACSGIRRDPRTVFSSNVNQEIRFHRARMVTALVRAFMDLCVRICGILTRMGLGHMLLESTLLNESLRATRFSTGIV